MAYPVFREIFFDGFFACKERAFLGFVIADFSDAELLIRRSNDSFSGKAVCACCGEYTAYKEVSGWEGTVAFCLVCRLVFIVD